MFRDTQWTLKPRCVLTGYNAEHVPAAGTASERTVAPRGFNAGDTVTRGRDRMRTVRDRRDVQDARGLALPGLRLQNRLLWVVKTANLDTTRIAVLTPV